MPINRKKFFDGVRNQPFDKKLTQGQVSGMTIILDEWERRKLTDLRWLGYGLGTAKWETDHTMQPISEGGGLKYLKSKRYYPWIGRGFVQLTWERNYLVMTKRLQAAGFKVDLIKNPELAMRPDVAAFIMFDGMINGVFTGKKFADYFNAKSDFVGARRIINGTDRAQEIASIAKAFYADLIIASA